MAEQPKARRRNTREELIKAGVEEINRYGVAGFSMRRIAQLCGVSCGAPYKHFGDRKEFIAAIIDDVNAQWHARQAELLAAYEGDTRKQIVEMSTGYVQFLAENPHLRAILTLKDRDFDNVYHRVRGELSSPTQRLIQRYCQEEQLDEETRQRKVYVLLSMIFRDRTEFIAAISDELFISKSAVRAHASRIYAKFAVHNRQEFNEVLDAYLPPLPEEESSGS